MAARLKKIDLTELLDDIPSFGEIIGPEEMRTLNGASILLKGQFPTNDAERTAYLTRSSQTQADLINLHSRVLYVHHMKRSQRNAYWGQLIDNEEYTGRDREALAMSRDSVFKDLEEVIGTLKIAADMIEQLLWSVKTITQRL